MGPTQCKFTPVNNVVSKRNYLLYHFSIINSPPPCLFLRDNIILLKKNQLEEMHVEKSIVLELRGPGPPGRICTPTTG